MSRMSDKIICGDCIEILSGIDEPLADLIFADPPFNIGYKYDKYHDRVKKNNYLAWTKDWMEACLGVLKPSGSFYIAIGDDYAANVKLIADELGLHMRNWIIWHYTFGQQMKNKFARAHTHIFYFVRDTKAFTFNDRAVRVPSDRQLIYNDRRANPAGKMPDDVWNEYSRVCGTFRERTGWHPCQMPENLLRRIIAVSSDPGDCVLDPFCGSGTTPAVAFQLGRRYVGIEISEQYAANARARLAGLHDSAGEKCSLTQREISELRRLRTDIRIPCSEILADSNLVAIVTRQFGIRMDNEKGYTTEQIAAALKEFCD